MFIWRGRTIRVVQSFVGLIVVFTSFHGCGVTRPAVVSEPPCTRAIKSSTDGDTIFFPPHGLSELRFNKAMWGAYNEFLPREQYAGKKATVLCSESVPGPGGLIQNVVALRVEGISAPVYVDSSDFFQLSFYSGSVHKAKKAEDKLAKYVGRQLWSKALNLGRDSSGKSGFINNLEPVTVVNVTADDFDPPSSYTMQFKRSNGQSFYQVFRSSLYPEIEVGQRWHEENPYLQFPQLTDKEWNLIRSQALEIGMTELVVRLSRGQPDEVNEIQSADSTTSQWVYRRTLPSSDRYLYFEGGVLTHIQD